MDDYVGRSFWAETSYQVGREKIREFATAIGADDPVHHDPDAARRIGYPDVVAPPTFAAAVVLDGVEILRDHPAIGIDHRRVVHVAQHLMAIRPICAGDELVCTATIVEILYRPSVSRIVFDHAVATVAGDPVVTVRTALATGEGQARTSA